MNLNEYVTQLNAVDDKNWFLYYCRPQKAGENLNFAHLIETAAEDGRSLACAKRPLLNGTLEQEMARDGLTIQYGNSGLAAGPGYFELACYLEPETVCVDTALIESVLSYTREEGLSMPGTDWKDVFLAHEYAHFLAVVGQPSIRYMQAVRSSKELKTREKNRLLSRLDEIFAMSFARELLRMEISPWLFNFLTLWKYDREKAVTLYQRVIRMD